MYGAWPRLVFRHRHFKVIPGIFSDHPGPEPLGSGILVGLLDFPSPGKPVENLESRISAHPFSPVLSQDKKLGN